MAESITCSVKCSEAWSVAWGLINPLHIIWNHAQINISILILSSEYSEDITWPLTPLTPNDWIKADALTHHHQTHPSRGISPYLTQICEQNVQDHLIQEEKPTQMNIL